MPIEGPIFFKKEVYIDIFGLWGVYIAKFTKKIPNIDLMKDWAEVG